jgi:NhaA family Na+:H+ antiporter
MSQEARSSSRWLDFLFGNSAFLILGTIAALFWANLAPASYLRFTHFDLLNPLGHEAHPSATHAETHDEKTHDEKTHQAGAPHDHDTESSHSASTSAEGAVEPSAEGETRMSESSESPSAVSQPTGTDSTGNEADADAGEQHAAADVQAADRAPAGDTAGTATHSGSGETAEGSSSPEAAHDASHGAAHAGSTDAKHPSDSGGHSHGHDGLTLHFLVNDILMAFFFAKAGKEVWEAMLPNGALSNPRMAATPLVATAGGVIGPVAAFFSGLFLCDLMGLVTWKELSSGWAVPCATDIAFSYLVARIIFGVGHPAIAFLLLLAIADDAAGLIILAVAYPQKPLVLGWLLLTVGAIVTAIVMQRAFKLHNFWWYLLVPGLMSWLSFYLCGIHAALGLIPIIPCLPHAHTDLGIFAKQELQRHDTLNEFEHWWNRPVELILGLFGLVNAGVAFSAVGVGTWLVLFGLLVGKPVGITLFTWLGNKFLKLDLPGGMSYRDVVTLGTVAGIGFTVALFVSTAAFPVPPNSQATLDAVKMGALGSFFASILALIVAKMLGVKPWSSGKVDSAAEGSASGH